MVGEVCSRPQVQATGFVSRSEVDVDTIRVPVLVFTRRDFRLVAFHRLSGAGRTLVRRSDEGSLSPGDRVGPLLGYGSGHDESNGNNSFLFSHVFRDPAPGAITSRTGVASRLGDKP